MPAPTISTSTCSGVVITLRRLYGARSMPPFEVPHTTVAVIETERRSGEPPGPLRKILEQAVDPRLRLDPALDLGAIALGDDPLNPLERALATQQPGIGPRLLKHGGSD